MSSYLNNLLTTTTSRYNSLRRQLLSDEADGDTEDDSHISRVLRAYYTEKGRPFPPWLPPDPKAPQQAPAQFVSSAGRQPGQPQMGRGGGLSDLWDAPSQQPPQQNPMSLRRQPPRGGRSFQSQGQGQGTGSAGGMLAPEASRPLPSQRAGTYQGSLAADPSPPPSAGSGTSAQERLKARLWGSGRSTSPAQSAPSSSNTSPAPGARNGPFSRPSGQPGRAPYPDDRGASGGGGRQGYNVMSANSPWTGGGGDEYDPYGPNGNYGNNQRGPPGGARMGLPSNPRSTR